MRIGPKKNSLNGHLIFLVTSCLGEMSAATFGRMTTGQVTFARCWDGLVYSDLFFYIPKPSIFISELLPDGAARFFPNSYAAA